MTSRAISRLGWISMLLALLLMAAAIPLHCLGLAAVVGAGSLVAGCLLGFAMAMITQTRIPLIIYCWLFIVILSFWPLYNGWPRADFWEVHAWPTAPDFVYNYFDLLRGGLFILAFPWVFARLGFHAADPIPQEPENLVQSVALGQPTAVSEPDLNLSGDPAETGETQET